MVIYCSRTSSTEKIAKRIAKSFENPLLEAEADVLYGSFFSTYVRVVADRPQKNLPKSVTETSDVPGYDTLFLGFLIWWGDIPDHCKEFLGRLETDDRCLIPFATSGRSDIGRAIESLRTLFPNTGIRNPFHFGIIQRDDYAF